MCLKDNARELLDRCLDMKKLTAASFGEILGYAPGDVPVYSCCEQSMNKKIFKTRHDFLHFVDDLFMGYKWQCVEFARRWLYLNKGYIFEDVAMAYDIFSLESVTNPKTDQQFPLRSFKNGSKRPPEEGCLLIWQQGGEFAVTGHVAVVTEVSTEYVRIVEQNVENHVWPSGQNFSRELKARVTDRGDYWIECAYQGAAILGWVIQTDSDTHAVSKTVVEEKDLNLIARSLPQQVPLEETWLNVANPDEAAFVQSMGGSFLVEGSKAYRYFCLSPHAAQEVKRATIELHAQFMKATDYVLHNESLLEQFNLPRDIWPKIHRSWNNRKNHMITGRFDFSLSERGLKLYEYNADSASCYMECGKIQNLWAQQFKCEEGVSSGASLHEALVQAWKTVGIRGPLHILQDRTPEETYHALYMKSTMERAGISCKIIHGIDSLHWNDKHEVVDGDGDIVHWVWKTWAWETALDQLRKTKGEKDMVSLRLADVLFHRNVIVFEPLWTLVTSNKAMLPVLWDMFPKNKYLLASEFELTDPLRASGYVVKPIVGRCGENIQIVNKRSEVLQKTSGQFRNQNCIYQEFFPLPRIEQEYIQLSAFSVAGQYAGACLRFDQNPVICGESGIYPLRVLEG